MDGELLLNEIRKRGKIKIPKMLLITIPDFMERETVVSLESLVLEMHGHRPNEKNVFNESKFADWLNENRLIQYFDEREQMYLIEKY